MGGCKKQQNNTKEKINLYRGRSVMNAITDDIPKYKPDYQRTEAFSDETIESEDKEALDIKEGLEKLVKDRKSDKHKHLSTKEEIENISNKYSLIIGKAKQYIEKLKGSKQDRECIKLALEGCIATFGGEKFVKKKFGGKEPNEYFQPIFFKDKSIFWKMYEINSDKESGRFLDARSWPLFPWRPCVHDLKQSELGDCWLEAALISIVNKHPEYIEDSLRDNGDGTVIGRVYEPKGNKKIPRYYRVEKTIPKHSNGFPSFSKNGCLWPEMIRKIIIKHKSVAPSYFIDMIPSYRSLHGGDITENNTRIFEFFCPDSGTTVRRNISSIMGSRSVKQSMFLPGAQNIGIYAAKPKNQYEFMRNLYNLSNGMMTFSLTDYNNYTKGLVKHHAYSILGFEERDGHYYVKIKNPWAEEESYDDYYYDDNDSMGDYDYGYIENDGIGRINITRFIRIPGEICYNIRRSVKSNSLADDIGKN